MREGQFIRVLGRRDALALAFGAIIGWSWVLLTGQWILTAGSIGALIAFAIGGLAMLFIGLNYAELAAAMPQAGGEHAYSYRALGYGASFVCTWALVLAYVTVVAFEAVALATALEYLAPQLEAGRLWSVAGEDVHLSWLLISFVAALVMIAVNVIGVKPAAVLQSIVTVVILSAGFMFAGGVLGAGSTENLTPLFVDGTSGVMKVLIMVPMMFIGFDVIPQAAEEIDLPFRAIGAVVIVSVVMALVWYLTMITGVAVMFPVNELPDRFMATADANAAAWGGGWAGNVMVLGGIAGILTSWNAFIVGASRAVYAMARSGMLPDWLGHLHPKYNTPHRAVILIGGTALISPLFGRQVLIWLIDAGGFAVIIAFALVALSFLALRRNDPALARPFRAGRGNFVGVAALVLSVALFFVYLPGSPAALVWPYEWLIVLLWALIGAVFYGWARRKNKSNGQ
ncbi:MAG: amino acid permease [Gammaproteobacteria bacterium]|jgi:APA family basic amino acid/polyamine antiporter